ncbi:extracellular solute-binding protein [Paenibacillus filicis]|uniref:Extracellular solute-binding protein n=1 Tax=Paenibacillus gyeongsangnamensis TaxID=3388067 RepID=A0ABT4Q2F7_9BACL|nr:extracellular solute-binding protein [Paenibacillus filicis]MCZ8510952.1 extracellular solute-binding protein [Paenibacillus filicis]
MRRKAWTRAGIIGMSLVALTACSKDVHNNEALPNVVDQKADLVVFDVGAAGDDIFNAAWGDEIRKKFPNYTIKYIKRDTKENSLTNILTAGGQIDIILSSIGLFPSYVIQPVDIQMDMTDLVQKHNLDLSKFEPESINPIKSLGGLYGIPYNYSQLALFYNKDIFDKFGVSYLKDGSTWDDILNKAKQLSREENGQSYVGFSYSSFHFNRLLSLSLPFINENNKFAMNTDDWKRFYEKEIISPLKGLSEADIKNTLTGDQTGLFINKRNIAMYVFLDGMRDSLAKSDVNWDMVSLPVFPEKPGIGSQLYPGYAAIAKTSKYPDQAMEVIKFMTSDEQQIRMAQKGSVSVLTSKAVKDAFLQDTPYKDKNVKNALFFNKPAPSPKLSLYDQQALDAITKRIPDMISGKIDTNTAFRDAEEEANKKIESLKK